jgi:hypothetical protein
MTPESMIPDDAEFRVEYEGGMTVFVTEEEAQEEFVEDGELGMEDAAERAARGKVLGFFEDVPEEFQLEVGGCEGVWRLE